MSEVIAITEIKREKGFIYPTGTDENGNLTILKCKAGRKAKVKEEVKKESVVEEVKVETQVEAPSEEKVVEVQAQ
jgi:hypothetical protein